MIWDSRILVYFFAQICVVSLLSYGLLKSLELLRFWSQGSGSEIQNRLEAQQDLLRGILNLVFWAQIVFLIYYLYLISNVAPPLVKGAMCASGVLNLSSGGEAVLISNGLIMPLAFAFMSLESIENQKLNFCFTPKKYILIILIFLISIVGFGAGVLFFSRLQPNIIVNCCSADSAMLVLSRGSKTATALQLVLVLSWLGFAGVLMSKNHFLNSLSTILFVVASIFALKWHYVKYIYGNPVHDCMFDLFIKDHNHLGYLILGSYLFFVQQSIDYNLKKASGLHKRRRWLFICANVIHFLPMVYWLNWRGSL